MSIHQINKLFQNKGCNIVMSIILLASVATFIGGVGFRGCGRNGQDPAQDEVMSAPIVTVGDFKITRGMLGASQNETQSGTDRMTYAERQVDANIEGGLALLLAKKRGIDLPDSAVKKALIDGEIARVRQSIEQQTGLPPTATEQEIENIFKQMTGQNLAAGLEKRRSQIDKELSNADTKAMDQAEAAPAILIDREKTRYTPTEDSFKQDTYHVKMISLDPKTAGPQGPKAKLEQILKEIRGGLTFEAAMDKYLPKPTVKGQKASDHQIPILASRIAADPALKGLAKLRPGQVSDVLQVPSPMLFKVIKRGVDLPDDFATQKASMIDAKAKNEAAKALSADLKKLDTPENVKWQSEGYHVLHDYLALSTTGNPLDKNRSKSLLGIIDRSLPLAGDPIGGDAAIAAAKLALDEAAPGMPAAQAADLKVRVLSPYVQQYPELNVKLQLAEAYIQKGDAQNTSASLQDTASILQAHTDAEGKGLWDQLNKDIKDAQGKNLIKPEDVKVVNGLYVQWLKDYSTQQAEAKRAAEEQKKVQEELNKAGKVPPTAKPPTQGVVSGKTTADKGSAIKDKTPPKKDTNSILHPSDNGTTGKP